MVYFCHGTILSFKDEALVCRFVKVTAVAVYPFNGLNLTMKLLQKKASSPFPKTYMSLAQDSECRGLHSYNHS